MVSVPKYREIVRKGMGTHATLLDDGLSVVSLVPLTERSGVNLNDASLDKGVGPDKLVVGSVVDYTDDSGLASGVLRSPGVVARLETKGTVLLVSSTSANGVDTLSTKFGHL